MIAIAGAAIAFSTWLRLAQHPYRDMAWPLALIGLVQLAVGATLLIRSPGQAANLQAAMAAGPSVCVEAELVRMQSVMSNFRRIELIEVVLLAGSLLALAKASHLPAPIVAIAMGLMLQAAVMLVFDLFAEHRAEAYVQWLQSRAVR